MHPDLITRLVLLEQAARDQRPVHRPARRPRPPTRIRLARRLRRLADALAPEPTPTAAARRS